MAGLFSIMQIYILQPPIFGAMEEKSRFFSQMPAWLVTKHGKHETIASALNGVHGLEVQLAPEIDTDILGTFSGEVERTDSPLETARKKAFLAAQHLGAQLVLASEGSFGPHPSAFFLPADMELLILVDVKRQLEWTAEVVSTKTNFDRVRVHSERELLDFARRVMFPSHALIVHNGDGQGGIIKGITNESKLLECFHLAAGSNGNAVDVETDMRAHFNPSRMAVIAEVAHKLAHKLSISCSVCECPGFAPVKHHSGLPCSWCGTPTRLPFLSTWACQLCSYHEDRPYGEAEKADPGQCDVCNP